MAPSSTADDVELEPIPDEEDMVGVVTSVGPTELTLWCKSRGHVRIMLPMQGLPQLPMGAWIRVGEPIFEREKCPVSDIYFRLTGGSSLDELEPPLHVEIERAGLTIRDKMMMGAVHESGSAVGYSPVFGRIYCGLKTTALEQGKLYRAIILKVRPDASNGHCSWRVANILGEVTDSDKYPLSVLKLNCTFDYFDDQARIGWMVADDEKKTMVAFGQVDFYLDDVVMFSKGSKLLAWVGDQLFGQDHLRAFCVEATALAMDSLSSSLSSLDSRSAPSEFQRRQAYPLATPISNNESIKFAAAYSTRKNVQGNRTTVTDCRRIPSKESEHIRGLLERIVNNGALFQSLAIKNPTLAADILEYVTSISTPIA